MQNVLIHNAPGQKPFIGIKYPCFYTDKYNNYVKWICWQQYTPRACSELVGNSLRNPLYYILVYYYHCAWQLVW